MVLVLIDLQRQFPASNDKKLISSVSREIRYCREYSYPIVNLLYEGHGSLRSDLSKFIRNYKFVHNVFKNSDDGAIDLLDYMFDRGIDNSVIRVCGVNLGMCVKSTLESLSVYAPDSRIELVKSGVACVKRKNFRFCNNLNNLVLI
jgi:nicotinamidase-related amidase